MDKDLDEFEAALMYFMRAMWRPKAWEAIQHSAKTMIDRPAASLLLTLSDTATGCRLHELAVRMGVEAPSVTRTVQRLEQDKLIARAVDPSDRRATRIVPTRQGMTVVRALRRAKRERLRMLLDGFSDDDRRQLLRLLQQLAQQAADLTASPERAETQTKLKGGSL